MVHKIVGAQIGVCASCHQRSELHEHPITHAGTCENCLALSPCGNCGRYARLQPDPNDGRQMCETCITPAESRIGQKLREKEDAKKQPGGVVMTDRRQQLLDYIVTNATETWIQNFVKQKMIELERRLIQENQWIQELEQEPNERVLLRIAASLGYASPPTRHIPAGLSTDIPKDDPDLQIPKGGRGGHKRGRYARGTHTGRAEPPSRGAD